MRQALRPTVRKRLALLLAAVILATGAVLLVASYVLVHANLNEARPSIATTGGGFAGPGTVTRSAGAPTLSPIAFNTVRGEIAHHTLGQLLVQYGAILAVLVVLAIVLAWLIAGRMLRPLRAITQGVQRITRERLDQRLALAGPADELKELGDTFDSMLERLDVAFKDQELFAANAAHELRTPLAVMRAELDLMLTDPSPSVADLLAMAGKLQRKVGECEKLTDGLLSLTRGAIADADCAPVQLDHLVCERLGALRRAVSEQQLKLREDLREAVARGDPDLLSELADNLLANAIKHNRVHGWIQVATRTDADRAVLEISNSGPTLIGEDLRGLLEPFRRADQQRVGNSIGLGLSIVRTIVDAHDGKLALHALTNGGLRVTVTLPALSENPDADAAAQERATNGRSPRTSSAAP
jgi:signal transduction histidine kinase